LAKTALYPLLRYRHTYVTQLILCFLSFFLLLLAQAFPTNALVIRRHVSASDIRDQSSLPNAQSSWSRQDILTFIGVGVAVLGIFTGLLAASPILRGWLCMPFLCTFDAHSLLTSKPNDQLIRLRAASSRLLRVDITTTEEAARGRCSVTTTHRVSDVRRLGENREVTEPLGALRVLLHNAQI
jgi:hypothetical protein